MLLAHVYFLLKVTLIYTVKGNLVRCNVLEIIIDVISYH